MRMPQYILNAIAEYHGTYRNPALSAPESSSIFALFPEEPGSRGAQHKWPDEWPLAGRSGAYLIFGPEMQLLYVGKAALLGARLASYFRYAAGRGSGCKIAHNFWKTRPTFIATIAVGQPFEAASLEEYLIRTVHPQENSIGLAKDESET